MKTRGPHDRPISAFVGTAVAIALTFTSLVLWWGYSIYELKVKLLHLQEQAGLLAPEHAAAGRRLVVLMVAGEGLTMLCLLGCALWALIYFYRRDQKKSRELKSLFALWSHECKTPIASIQLQAESLLMNASFTPECPVSANSQKVYLERIVSDYSRLQSFVERILEIVRAQQLPRLEVESGDIAADVNQWWQSVGLVKFQPRLKVQLPQASSYYVLRESQALSHILNNIAENAIKYGSHLLVFSFDQTLRGTTVRIASAGTQFPEESIKSLGQLFSRGKNSVAAGTGVGLFLIARLMEKMGGEAHFYNDPNATVDLTFRNGARRFQSELARPMAPSAGGAR
jgi:signal transduction histidine kinase